MTKLIEEIKNRLDITDDSYNQKLESIIDEGIMKLKRFNPILTENDFDSQTLAKALLIAYCRYAVSDAEEVFFENYKSEILNLRQEYEVNAYDVEAKTDS